MKLESQVCSLDLAKRLKELGVKQESLFWYFGTKEEFERGKGYAGPQIGKHKLLENISAFTVAELGEMLPKDYIVAKEDDGRWRSWKLVGYEFETLYPVKIVENTEADARAKMLVYLLENKLITL